jgi:hypothetical protein
LGCTRCSRRQIRSDRDSPLCSSRRRHTARSPGSPDRPPRKSRVHCLCRLHCWARASKCPGLCRRCTRSKGHRTRYHNSIRPHSYWSSTGCCSCKSRPWGSSGRSC